MTCSTSLSINKTSLPTYAIEIPSPSKLHSSRINDECIIYINHISKHRLHISRFLHPPLRISVHLEKPSRKKSSNHTNARHFQVVKFAPGSDWHVTPQSPHDGLQPPAVCWWISKGFQQHRSNVIRDTLSSPTMYIYIYIFFFQLKRCYVAPTTIWTNIHRVIESFKILPWKHLFWSFVARLASLTVRFPGTRSKSVTKRAEMGERLFSCHRCF